MGYSNTAVILNMFVLVDSVVFIPFLSLSCLESSVINQSETTLEYFDPLQTHKYHAHTHTPCLMMGEVPLETSPKNIMIQDMINSKTILQ